jgi:hypothetical protein
MTAKGDEGRSLGLSSQPYKFCFVLFSGSFIGSNHVCIVSMFLNIPASQAYIDR